jgi:hypothetical protein
VTHELLGDTDDSLSCRYGADLPEGFSIEVEALDHVVVAICPQGGRVAGLCLFAKER